MRTMQRTRPSTVKKVKVKRESSAAPSEAKTDKKKAGKKKVAGKKAEASAEKNEASAKKKADVSDKGPPPNNQQHAARMGGLRGLVRTKTGSRKPGGTFTRLLLRVQI